VFLAVTLNNQRIPQKMPNIYGYTWIADWTRKNIYISSVNNLDYNWGKCIGYSAVNHNCRLKSCTRQFSNLSLVFNCTASNTNIEILQRFQNKILRIIFDAPWYITNDTLHHDLNMPYIRNKIRRHCQRYADRMKEHPNIFTKNLVRSIKTPRRLKRKQDSSARSMHLSGVIL